MSGNETSRLSSDALPAAGGVGGRQRAPGGGRAVPGSYLDRCLDW
ncbi:hypothetical protein [Pseudonocardia cypriaca]|nr:hypothetical protein [Pseudonocardia cypriaca]